MWAELRDARTRLKKLNEEDSFSHGDEGAREAS